VVKGCYFSRIPPVCLAYLAKRFIDFFYRQCGKGAHMSVLAEIRSAKA